MENQHSDDDRTQTHVVISHGTMVQHYRIIQKIGAGGMGEVFLAEDTKLHRKVALKFLPSRYATDADFKARFVREAEAMAKLNHPNIITIFEVSEYHGRPFFAMELVEGQSLRDFFKGRELDFEKILNLAIQICDGLSAAHEKQVVHRDIKPSNIVIDAYGRPKVLDFGLAAIQGVERITKTGSTLGTVQYMSPEQVGGKTVDHRSDLFSFGIVLYEMISGRTPFERGNEGATLKAIANDDPEPLARYKSEVPDELQRIVAKLLEKDPAYRYQTATGVISDLKQELRSLTSDESTAAQTARVKRSTGKSLLKWFLPAAVIIFVTIALVLKPWKFEISPSEVARAAENRVAIMYFDNLADSSDSLRLGEIAANLLITDLTESSYLDIVSTQALYDILKNLGQEGQKKIDRETATQVARKAGAKWMLLGSILQSEPHFVVTSQLVDVESGTATASQRVSGEEGENIFAVIDRLTIEVKNDMSLPAQAKSEPDRPVAEVTTNSPEAMRHYLEALDYSKKLYYVEAMESYTKALYYDSTFAEAHYRLGINEYYTGRGRLLPASIAQAVKYIDNAPRVVRTFIRSMDNLIKGDYSAAGDILQKECEQSPQEKEAFMLLSGLKYFLQFDAAGAIPLLKKVTEIDPLDKLAYNYLAYAYNEIDDIEKSTWAINKYISLAPNEANPYDTRGDLYAIQGQLDKAIASYKKALSIKPDLSFTLSEIGNLHLYKQDYASARKYYRRLVTSKNQEARWGGREKLGFIPIYQGKLDEALKVIDQAMASDQLEYSKDATSPRHRLKAYVFLEKGNLDSALVEIEKAIEIARARKQDYRYWHHYAQILAERGEFEKAEEIAEALRPVLEQKDRRLMRRYWFAKGRIALAQSEFDKAIDHFKRAIALANKDIRIYARQHLALARAYLEAGQLGEAVTEYENILIGFYEPLIGSSLFDIVKAHYYLGTAYEASGWDNKAIKRYEIFLDIWRDADEGIKIIEDAKERLAKLKNGS